MASASVDMSKPMDHATPCASSPRRAEELSADKPRSTTRGTLAYKANLRARRFPVNHFLPRQGLHPFTGTLTADGSGTDLFSPRTRLQAAVHSQQFAYSRYNLSGIKASANIRGGHIKAHVNSANPLFKGLVDVSAQLNRKAFIGTISCDLANADLYALHLADKPITLGMCGHVDVRSDLKQHHDVDGMFSDITLSEGKRHYRPQEIMLDILTTRDTTHAIVDCGDFHLNMDGSGSYERLLKHGNALVTELQRQMTNKYIDEARLRRLLPSYRYASPPAVTTSSTDCSSTLAMTFTTCRWT